MTLKLDRRQLLKTTAQGAMGTSFLSGLAGCSTAGNNDNVINMGVTSRPRMLDPRQATDALSSRINRLLYSQLIDFDSAFQAIPDLAAWQQLSPTNYRFNLLELPRFHNGMTLTSKDVKATYDSILDVDTGSPHRGSLKNISRIVVLNERQIDFYLHKEDALFVGRLVIGILPKELIDQQYSFAKTPVGSGPCRFVSSSEQKLVLARKDNVHLQFLPVKDANVRVLKLLKGELDIIQNNLSPELLSYCEQQKGVLKVYFHPGTNFGYIGFNFDDPLLNQLAMREALAYGIDRQQIIDKVFVGHARLAGGLLVPEHWCGSSKLKGFEFNLEKARERVAQLKKSPGVGRYLNDKNEIELSYKTSSDPTRIRLATVYQSQLKKIGIHLNIQSYDWGTFYSDIKQGRFQLYSLAWVGVKSPDIFQYIFDSKAIPPKGANRGRYKDSLTDDLIHEAANTQDLEEQASLYRELQARLQQNLATIPLWYEDQYCVMRNDIEGYELFSDGRFDGLLNVTKKRV